MKTLSPFHHRGSQPRPEQSRRVTIALVYLFGLLIFFTWFVLTHFEGYAG